MTKARKDLKTTLGNLRVEQTLQDMKTETRYAKLRQDLPETSQESVDAALAKVSSAAEKAFPDN